MARRYLRKDPVTKYALDVRAGEILAGPHVRAACERHLRDFQTAKSRGLRYDAAAAKWVIDFFPKVLRLAGGDHERRPFKLEPWQAFVAGSLFGWKRKDGNRRFRVAYIETGKGSGKTPFAAGTGLYMMMADGRSRAEVYAAAVDKDQASILFRDAVAMAKLSDPIMERVKFSGGEGREFNIAHPASGSFFRPISSESSGRGKSGYRPHCVLLDEIHEHPTSAMVEFMRAGVKGNDNALIFMITNSGVDRNSVCWEYHQYAEKVVTGELDGDEGADSFFGYVCANDEGDDPFEDSSIWAKTNPSLGVTIPVRYLEEQVGQARGMPGKEALVRRLNFCEWTDAESPWIDGDLWRACEEEGELRTFLEEHEDFPCYLALDLSSARDLTSLSAVWPTEEGYSAATWAWTPKDTLLERERKDQAPYGVWVERGFLQAVEGRIIDYRYIADQVAELMTELHVLGLAFDQWRIEQFQRDLTEHAGVESWIAQRETDPDTGISEWVEQGRGYAGDGLMMVRHGQGTGGGTNKEKYLWMPDSISALEKTVMQGNLRILKNPVLTWASASAVLHSDPAGNRKWEKRKSKGRIDAVVSLSMAVGLAQAAEQSDYSDDDAPLITILGR